MKKYLQHIIYNEWIDDIYPNNDLYKNLYMLYEWEYKYHKVSRSEQFPPRIERIKQSIKTKMTPVIKTITKQLSIVFKEWLDEHNINSAEEWAKNRYKYKGNIIDLLEVIFNDSARYADRHKLVKQIIIELYDDIFYDEIQDSIRDHIIETMPINRQHVIRRLDLKNPLNGIQFLRLTKMNLPTFISDALNKIERIGGAEISHIVNILVNIGKTMFKNWLKTWNKNKKLEYVINDISKAYDMLLNLDLNDFSKTIADLNIVLNISHSNGYFLEYISQVHPNVTRRSLSFLSDLPQQILDEWDNELKKMVAM